MFTRYTTTTVERSDHAGEIAAGANPKFSVDTIGPRYQTPAEYAFCFFLPCLIVSRTFLASAIAPSRFPSPTTLIDAARGEQEDGHESCHRLDNDIHHVRFDMVREKGNMNDSIMVASPPSTSTSTSALIDPGIGNVPQPSSRSVRPVNLEAGSHLLLEDSLPGPSRDDDVISHPDIRKSQNKKRLRGSEDDELQCDRAHFFD